MLSVAKIKAKAVEVDAALRNSLLLSAIALVIAGIALIVVMHRGR